jgi:hypothetical protein
MELQYKHGNYVLEMSLAAYELLKGAIKEYFQHHDNYTIQVNDQKDQQGLCVSTSYSVRNRKNNKQQYRINLYHTTCRAEVNGHGREQFLPHLQDMAVMMDNKGNCSQLNKLLESQIRQCMDSMTQYGSMSASNSSSDGPLVPISHSPHLKDVKKKANRASPIATIQHNSTRASGDTSLVSMQHHSTHANGDAPLAKTTPLRKSPCISGEHQNETQSSGDASLLATTSLHPLRLYASGEASLVTEEHQNKTQSSGDASLVATTSLHPLRLYASGEASLVTEEHQNKTQTSGDASLVAKSLQPWRPYAGGEASLVTQEHQNETQTSGDASLVAKSLQPWSSYASGEASLVTNIQQKAAHASGDTPLAEVSLQCKRQCASGDASLANTALDSHSQCTGGEDIIICAICQRDISSNNSPAYFCSQCELLHN